ncbi:hypothetical protein [Dactylosporangium matsuzakiense]|uniref:Uncharacterized protein n=1 Tax=Dactylosporangium matsuzakiense TaxID=53360 RepID=A0A9W6KKM9_9ACTN|nr:hypothetical protein [Dactylosporangium matsuzakiense]UWZ43173.1 hypothetical protein Dmats_37650 [Dactylosporangium matsuzakiense]GLL02737.1 hypothetical protein GCM10017581_044790 [Dactylosporangium matsuzakiense]
MLSARSLFVYCTANQALRCARIAERPGAGLVIAPYRHDERGALATAAYLRDRSQLTTPILLDAARYAGQNRLPASAPFNPRWLRRQRELGLPVLTDSGYVDGGDEAGLVSILHRTMAIPDGIAVLPLNPVWLRDRLHLTTLTNRVRDAGVAIALVLEARGDPFGLPGTVAGLLEVLGCGVPTLLLRSDLSSLGALCHGAVAAAVGTTGALRHLAPRESVPMNNQRGPRPPATIFKPTMSYRRISAIQRAKRSHPDPRLWSCDCDACAGRDLDWMAALDDREREVPAFEHAAAVLFALRDEVLSGGEHQNRNSWAARCADAAYRERELGWPVTPMLRHWRDTAPNSVEMPLAS